MLWVSLDIKGEATSQLLECIFRNNIPRILLSAATYGKYIRKKWPAEICSKPNGRWTEETIYICYQLNNCKVVTESWESLSHGHIKVKKEHLEWSKKCGRRKDSLSSYSPPRTSGISCPIWRRAYSSYICLMRTQRTVVEVNHRSFELSRKKVTTHFGIEPKTFCSKVRKIGCRRLYYFFQLWLFYNNFVYKSPMI